MEIYQASIEDLEGVSNLFNSYRMFYQQTSDLEGAKAYIKERIENQDLYVDGKARKKGVGEMLLQQSKEFAIETGAKSISLSTALDNDAAQRLYERNGYIRDSRFFHYELSFDLPIS